MLTMPTVRQTKYTNYNKLSCSLPSIPKYTSDLEFTTSSRFNIHISNNGMKELSTPKIEQKYLDTRGIGHANIIEKSEKGDLFDIKLPVLHKPIGRRRIISERREFSVHPFPKLGSGHGIYIYENKFFKYEGQWRNGLKHGQGKLYMSDGSYYSGQFSNGEIDGQGFRYFGHTKSEYNGDFRKGEMHGRGRMVYSTGDIYEGQWYRNRKHGYGVMRTAGPETCGPETYEGGYNGDLRDGYGLMLYGTNPPFSKRNGDQYEGYWKNDIRVGRGVLKFADGSTYDGEFLKDMFHGQGLLRHSSGIVYNGEWINGYPRHISTKLVIVIEETDKKKVKKDKTEEEKVKTKKIIHQGVPFTIKVECRNEKDELIEDEGRELRLSAGFRHYPTVKSDDSALFDMIEDMEEKPIETPFGYSVVPYPITDQLHVNVEELDDLETDNDDLERSQTDFQNEESPQESDEKENNVDENGEEKVDVEKSDEENGDDRNENETINEEQTTPSIPLPPPVPNQRTTHGVCMWNELQLPPAPPGYRPFKSKEQFERDSNSKRSKSKEGRSSRQNTTLDRFRHNKKKSLEEKFAKTGEYVLMVHDVTNPPYLDKKLTPAFLLLKLKPPEIEKRKDNKAKWNTAEHIRTSMIVSESPSTMGH